MITPCQSEIILSLSLTLGMSRALSARRLYVLVLCILFLPLLASPYQTNTEGSHSAAPLPGLIPSTSRLQKSDMMPFAVTSTSFLGVYFAVILSTFELTCLRKQAKPAVAGRVELGVRRHITYRHTMPTLHDPRRMRWAEGRVSQ